MMKKAYTLIELIVVLSILVIFSTVTIGGIKYFKDKSEDLNFENYVYEVKSLLSFAKSYCRKNKVIGNIIISSDRKSIIFDVTDKTYKLNKRVDLDNSTEIGSNFKLGNNKINDEGFIKEAGTITLSNKNSKFVKITISVGNDIIRVSENDDNEGDMIE
ncbi:MULTISPECIES: type II secretion system protein [Clostridium]|jgi:prepilin-type N-terminal cleavage/methylation domain-containing protein|nr:MULTISPECIES: type II secretion system protein [Clostridium]